MCFFFPPLSPAVTAAPASSSDVANANDLDAPTADSDINFVSKDEDEEEEEEEEEAGPPPASSSSLKADDGGAPSSSSCVLASPFDEKEEWNKISQIIDSFGADIGDAKATESPDQCQLVYHSDISKREREREKKSLLKLAISVPDQTCSCSRWLISDSLALQ